MKNKMLKIAPFLILILLVCACQPARNQYVIVNTTDENMELKYKSASCNNEGSGGWQPQTRSEADFKNDDGSWTSLNAGDYKFEQGTEPNESSKTDCTNETYTLNVAPHTAVKIFTADLNFKPTLNLIELKGGKGNIKYEGTPMLIMETFKSYSNNSFNFFGDLHDVLWY